MADSKRVLLVANRTAMTDPLRNEVLKRAAEGNTTFHLLVPASPSGLHRVVDPEIAGRDQARARMEEARALLSEASGAEVTGEVGDANPVYAVDAVLRDQHFDEIILSTLPPGPSRWLKLDLPSRLQRQFRLPLTHVVATKESVG